MTLEDFTVLPEQEKRMVLFDANKVDERIDQINRYELFKVDQFFIEVKTCLVGKFKRFIQPYTLKDLPLEYCGKVLALIDG